MAEQVQQRKLFLGCFVALIATAFAFIVRATILSDWRVEFNLSGEQLGYIQGAGLFPFAISIILFSLIIDRIGYGRAMVFAFAGHVISAVVTIFATDFTTLYIGTFLFALANGVVEAVINPVVATVYKENKTHWLNILHAGWPGGLVLGGLLAIAMGSGDTLGNLPGSMWQWKVALVLLPTLLYGLLLFGQKFPVQERVAAGVSYLDMLKEFGTASCLIVCFLLVRGIDQILLVVREDSLNPWIQIVLVVVPTILFAVKVQSFGRPMFVFLLLIMVLLATTELGTDSWIADIMASVLQSASAGALVLVYTSLIMFVLRFFAGPIVHRISPLGLLASSAAIATVGLLFLSSAGSAAMVVFIAATCYGVGKTFFWPTTLGLVSEQFPKGGALMLNAIAGVGMIAVGVLGNPAIGILQDRSLDRSLAAENPAIHQTTFSQRQGILGEYNALDQGKLAALSAEEQETVSAAVVVAKQGTLANIAVLPGLMFVCYVLLILYFKSKGGYQAEVLIGHGAEDEKFTGGTEGPADA